MGIYKFGLYPEVTFDTDSRSTVVFVWDKAAFIIIARQDQLVDPRENVMNKLIPLTTSMHYTRAVLLRSKTKNKMMVFQFSFIFCHEKTFVGKLPTTKNGYKSGLPIYCKLDLSHIRTSR